MVLEMLQNKKPLQVLMASAVVAAAAVVPSRVLAAAMV